MKMRTNFGKTVLSALLFMLSAAFIFPILIVLINSFKTRFSINLSPFSLPDSATFAGIENYINGIADTSLLSAFGYSLFITVASVAVIVVGTAMTAWYLVRVENKLTKFLYLFFVFSMIIPFSTRQS